MHIELLKNKIFIEFQQSIIYFWNIFFQNYYCVKIFKKNIMFVHFIILFLRIFVCVPHIYFY